MNIERDHHGLPTRITIGQRHPTPPVNLITCWVCGNQVDVTKTLPILGRPERCCLKCDDERQKVDPRIIGKAIREFGKD